jgi:N-acetyl-anhydromuramyl-L-alanine amidase AmpD
MGKGDGEKQRPIRVQVQRERIGKDALSTLAKAAALTGLGKQQLKSDAVANVCGGAAVLAAYQREAGGARDLGDWSSAVARYSGADDQATALRFAKQVFRVIRAGKARITNDGQRMFLRANPSATVDRQAVEALGLPVAKVGAADCPPGLACEWLPSPYAKTGPSPGAYGHYDLGDRPETGNIDYIVMHDTEATWNTTLQLINTPTYAASWHYTIRSADGYIAQHVANDDVAWHAGNWYVNMHSIGIEQEGFAADGAAWFTESLYQSSARLVRHLAREYGVPIDRAHIIGHDQVPGTTPGTVAGMHWDPGPYWNWEHYFQLLGHPIHPAPKPGSTVVTVRPGFDDNQQLVTHCDDDVATDDTCPAQGTNFLYLYSQPDLASPLVTDIGLKPTGAPSTTIVSDIGARAAAGQQLVVQEVQGDWTKVWWLGADAWVYNPVAAPTLVPSQGQVVTPVSTTAVPVYGRAYPEASAYPPGTTVQGVVPLQYSVQPGQQYVLADADIETDYYKANTFNCSVQPDCIQIQGVDRYYEIWFGHRIAYVRAADVTVADGVVTPS